MPSYRISTVADLLGVSDDSVRRWLEDGLIEPADTEGPLEIEGASLVTFLKEKPDIHQLTSAQNSHSIRNHLPGLVTKITSDRVMSQVEVQCGRYRLVSLISTEAVKQLQLELGSLVIAQVKATNLSLEIPPKKGSTNA